MTSRFFLGAAALLLLPVAGSARGEIIANFDGGGGTTAVDQYPGMPGDGWVGAWQRHGSSGSAEILSIAPLNEGGNYLNSSATTGTQGVRRQYADYGAVGLDRPHTITFDFRVDTLPDGWGTSTSYRVHVFDHDSTAATPGADSSWMGIVYGSSDRGNWEFANCIGSSANWVPHDTGVPLVAGALYSFAITVYPGDTGPNYVASVGPTYDLTIVHSNGTYSVEGLGLRNDSGPGGYLNWSMAGTSTGATGFSLDSVRIVPEPASAGLLLCGAIASLLCLSPRRRLARRRC